MYRRRAFNTSLLLLALWSVAGWTDPASGQPPTGSAEQSPILLILAGPITDTDCARYAQILALSPEQKRAMASGHAIYLSQWEALVANSLPEVNGLAKAAVDADSPSYNGAAVAAYATFYAAEARLDKLEEALDQTFVDNLVPILTDEQRARVPRVIQHRERARSRVVPPEMPSAIVDLSWMVERLELPDAPSKEVDELLAAYEVAVTPSMVKVAKGERSRSARQDALLNELKYDEHGQPRAMTANDQRTFADAYQSKMEEVLKPSAQQQRKVVTTNRQYFPLIAMALPAKESAAFATEYRSMAYPHVYPDALEPSRWYEQIRTIDGLDQEHRAAMQAVWELHQADYAHVCNRMEEAYDAFCESIALTLTTSQLEVYQKVWYGLLIARWDRTLLLVDQLKALVPPEKASLAAPIFKDFEALNQQMRQMASEHRIRGP